MRTGVQSCAISLHVKWKVLAVDASQMGSFKLTLTFDLVPALFTSTFSSRPFCREDSVVPSSYIRHLPTPLLLPLLLLPTSSPSNFNSIFLAGHCHLIAPHTPFTPLPHSFHTPSNFCHSLHHLPTILHEACHSLERLYVYYGHLREEEALHPAFIFRSPRFGQ